MEAKEIFKPVILLFLYGFAAPMLGMFLYRRRHCQRVVFAAMCFMTISGIFGPAEWGLTMAFDENFRGHSRGFHCYFNEVLALGLIIGIALEQRGTRLMPPGLWLYLAYCLLSLVSILNAPEPVYTLMSAFKAFKIAVIFVAAYNFVRSEKDLHLFLSVMSVTMIWQMLVVLKLKYVDRLYQVHGTFEHQNSLAMFATMIGMVLLAAGAGPGHKRTPLYVFSFLACAVIVQSTLSRAGLVVFAVGTSMVLLASFWDRLTRRRLAVAVGLSIVAVIGLSMTLDTIIARFKDDFNLGSNETRRRLNEASLAMVKDNPLGVGWNNYAILINWPYRYSHIIDDYYIGLGYRVDPYHIKGIEEGHYHLLLAETGVQSLLAYLALIGLFLYWNARGIRLFRGQFLGALSVGIAMGCGLNYLHSMIERVLTQPRNMMLWLLLLAITARIETWRRSAARKRRTMLRQERKKAAAQPRPYAAVEPVSSLRHPDPGGRGW